MRLKLIFCHFSLFLSSPKFAMCSSLAKLHRQTNKYTMQVTLYNGVAIYNTKAQKIIQGTF